MWIDSQQRFQELRRKSIIWQCSTAGFGKLAIKDNPQVPELWKGERCRAPGCFRRCHLFNQNVLSMTGIPVVGGGAVEIRQAVQVVRNYLLGELQNDGLLVATLPKPYRISRVNKAGLSGELFFHNKKGAFQRRQLLIGGRAWAIETSDRAVFLVLERKTRNLWPDGYAFLKSSYETLRNEDIRNVPERELQILAKRPIQCPGGSRFSSIIARGKLK